MADESLRRDVNFVPVLAGITDDANQFIKMVRVDPVTNRVLISIIGSSIVELPATGSVNGVNTTFTFTSLPTYIVSDHGSYKQTNKNGTTNWTWNAGTLTATMTIPPTEDIYGVQ